MTLKPYLLLGLLFVYIGCLKKDGKALKEDIILSVNDNGIVTDSTFHEGDVRRYGIFPNQPINQDRISKVLELAQKGVKIEFPPGIYNTNLIIKGLHDISIFCDDVIITGSLQIIDFNNKQSNNISINGNLTILDKVFIRKSSNIVFDTLAVKTDTLQNRYHKMNRGVSIYTGSKNIKIKTLKIFDTGGSNDNYYQYTAAALQVHGWNNNPEFITIDKLIVENAHRTAVYLTGKGHIIKKAIIKNYAFNGENANMFGLEDAIPGSEKEFAGFWLNKCNNCEIDSLEISNNYQKPYSLKFGIGIYSEPAVINYLSLKGEAKFAPIEDDLLTNVLVKHEY